MENISKFVELVNKNIWETKLSKIPPQIYIGVQDGYCNLKCPMCFIHSESNTTSDTSKYKGIMPFENYCKILDELKGSNTTINPYRFTEPLLIKNLRDCIIAAKDRNLSIALDTNGLLLTKEMADFFVKEGLDSIMFSIDAMTSDTLAKVRGVRQIEKIKASVFMMLEARGNLSSPRIGVSFVESESNHHEKQEFIDYWINHVDVIRVNKMFDGNKVIKDLSIPKKRFPCYALYSKMVINFNGDVTICTTDAFNVLNVGNVFTDGVLNVWNSPALNKIRQYHESGQFEKLPFCKECNLWADSSYQDSTENGILIRKSQSVTYYNRLDRIETWKLQQKGRSSNTKA
ncbi:MAG: SPASM domain-containing protein [Proteobacteria bacterium]|nr:SPASM domain-containing protein [Pseudomonadota bacterium]MBU1388911.1 SPASM domain-containing protein [Pseudomonadota bacterium]MBU1543463.1 SPASM domain-containing protein [Pseudomonadota bacterium]MBU2430273.1 SPASM domain-containing protein [Pseudomonadota bacterium]